MYFCFRFVSFCFSPVLSLTRQAHRSISVFDLVFLHLVPSLMSYINLQNMLIYMCMSYVLYTLENKTLIAVENRDGLCVRFIAAGPNWRSSTRIPNYKPATERTIFWKPPSTREKLPHGQAFLTASMLHTHQKLFYEEQLEEILFPFLEWERNQSWSSLVFHGVII